ncbi:T3SS effector HopA1 family protein [Providencia rettgeri]|uniref:T3SS effector HopA1 family protein n=1 Tax=Providencia rettgeri TaxID=587 RepID=UPI0023AAF814|nr:T3SS effector HopA1 family protein [Providencia rettgeri]
MGKDSYNSMLWLARSGRYIIGNDDKYNELIKKIKIDFKLNNNSWNDLLRGDKKEIEGKITDVIYHLYSNDKPDNSESLNKEEKERFLESFESLLTEGVREKVEIKVQGQNERPFFELTKEQLLNGSAYRILPKDYRKRYLTRSHLMARLTINVNKKNYENLAKALIEIYDHDLNKNIIQAKIMGPRKLGRLTDQAVIYLAEADLEKAQEVSQQLIDLLPPDALVDHTPIGMTQLMKGISYSETMGGQSTSHGESRAVIMAKAITESLLTDEKLKIVLPRMLQHYGYDSKDPAFISLAIKDRFLKTSLYHPEIEHEIETPSRDIQNFTLNPEVFCYGYKLNESSLNKIKNIPEIGKVIFYRNNHGYDINFVDNSYEAGIPYALDCYFLNTDLKEKESEVPEYVNVSKKIR